MSENAFTKLYQTLRGNPLDSNPNPCPLQPQPTKKKRNLPGTPDPEAEVIALSPCTLMTKNRFICEICNKGFQRDQNLQLHRRGHNLPWKLRQRSGSQQPRKRVYVCPEPSCVHHNPARALGDLTGVKKHFSRKHGEKRWKCDRCSKRYAVQSDWKAHCKTCGSREYKCDCGTVFSRKDSFITHRAFCDALTKDAALNYINFPDTTTALLSDDSPHLDALMVDKQTASLSFWLNQRLAACRLPSDGATLVSLSTGSAFSGAVAADAAAASVSVSASPFGLSNYEDETLTSMYISYNKTQRSASPTAPHLSATALLQRAAQMGATRNNCPLSSSSWGLMSSSLPGQRIGSSEERLEGFQDLLASPFPSGEVKSVEGGIRGCSMDSRSAQENFNMKPFNMKSGRKEMECGLTRDFLGLGREVSLAQPLLQPELAKLASMSYAMNMLNSAYNGFVASDVNI